MNSSSSYRHRVYNLKKLIKEELQNGSNDLVTRQTGEQIRERIEKDLRYEDKGQIVILNFLGIGIIDYSCADEIVAKLISRLIGNEYGDKYILLKNLTPNQSENIQVALERKNLAALSVEPGHRLKVLGSLNPYLNDVLEEVNKRKSITARHLADLTQTEINSASTKLLNLYKVKLVVRASENLPDGGRQYEYKSLLS